MSKQVQYKGYLLLNQGLSWWCGATWVGASLAEAKRWVNRQLDKGN